METMNQPTDVQSASTSVFREMLINGDGSQGLTGWTIPSGSFWSTENGPGQSCPQISGNSNFVTSNTWATKSQLIDLVAAGFTADYLDTAPRIYIEDWVCGRCDAASTYALRIELRDANQNVIKTLVTPHLDTPRAGNWTYPWRRIFREFHRYGSGLRYIYFEHGGSDVPGWGGWYGAKTTGASVKVATMASRHRNLLQNPDGASGMDGWTVLTSSGNGWSVEAVAASCPSSAGQTNFVTSYGWSMRRQVVDLIAAGYTAEQLDASPDIRAEEWMCGRSDAGSQFYLRVNLLDVNHNLVQSFTTEIIGTPLLPNFQYPFTRTAHIFIDYPPGVRFVSFEDGGSDTVGWEGYYGAKMTGAYVGVDLPVAHPRLPRLGEKLPAAIDTVDNRVRVSPTNVVPAEWVCDLHMKFKGGSYTGSGWLMATTGPYAVVVTAGHCTFVKELGFPLAVTVFPARNNGVEPYSSYRASGNRIQTELKYIVDANGGKIARPLYDLGAIVVPKSQVNWGSDGFVPTVASDAQLQAMTLTVTGYPGDKPDDTMWTANGHVTALDGTSFQYSGIYTAEGQSGCPVYDATTTQVVGIHVAGLSQSVAMNQYGGKATRVTNDVVASISNWATPLTAATQVTSLQLIIQTGIDEGAGTNDTINFKLKGVDFGNPDNTWFKDRSERNNIDGYDLTAKMNDLFPNGLYVRDLVGAQYQISTVFEYLSGWGTWFWGEWEVDSVAIYVNGQRLHAKKYKLWLGIDAGKTALSGTITEVLWSSNFGHHDRFERCHFSFVDSGRQIAQC